jgi:hypothetical protein
MQFPPDGLVLVAKRECPTCVMIEPIARQLATGTLALTVFSQDDPSFPAGITTVVDDRELEASYKLNIEIVPTLIRIKGGREVGRVYGWHREEWETLAGLRGLGPDLPESRPGCGSRSLEPGIADELAIRFGARSFDARRIEISERQDDIEACYGYGWSDGLPLVPPTPVRVHRMLQGTTRDAREVLGLMPPNLAPCSVEKVAINAVMAGCLPEYLPVVLAAVEAILDEAFCMHGVLATTMYVGPIVIVNGPIRRQIGMNWGVNALGQGNRANATIGRAVQLVVRNVGGGKPGGVDRATLGNPGKYTFCFAEDEDSSLWEPLSVERGIARGKSAVTVFAGYGLQGVVDQLSRTPDSLAKTFAACLRTVQHPKKLLGADAFVVVSPEHYRTFREAGWSKAATKQAIEAALQIPAREVLEGVDGIAEGMPLSARDKVLGKFRPGGLNLVRAGGGAGLFSAILAGWAASGERGSVPVTKEIKT